VTTKTISFREFMANEPKQELFALDTPSQFFTEEDMNLIHNAYYFMGSMFFTIYIFLKLEKRYRHKDQPQIADRYDLALRIFVICMFVLVVWKFWSVVPALLW
jgi:hypothetical protein